ncbi:MAG: 9-O-acetylesterase [Planctomycetes bacterium]|nr:9-O-acetylesterase [Planctomycetota bacterium]
MHFRRLLPVVPFLVAPLLTPARADVELPAVLASHMVVQRETDLVVWGFATAGEQVSVEASWGAKAGPVASGADGRFELVLRTPAAGGPHTLKVRGANELVLDDVWSGEVWLCSGQSNMEMPMEAIADWYTGTTNREAELARADLPQLRLFEVPNELDYAPRTRVKGEWKACNRESLRTFSATGYYFGRELHEKLGVPVGLISADWGGTVCEAWTSAEALKRHGGFDEGLASIAALAGDPKTVEQTFEAARAAWWQAIEEKEPGSGEFSRARERLDAGKWPLLDVPGEWGSVLGDFDGVVWLRHTIVVPPKYSDQDLVFTLGAIDDMDTFYFNGERVDGGERPGLWSTPRKYTVPKKLVRAGRNVIALRVIDTGGLGGLTGKPEELGFRSASDVAPKLQPIAGKWSYYRGVSMKDLPPLPAPPSADPNRPSVLYNAMIAPLAPFALRGAIWYQGESNRPRAKQYETLFPAMIADWRERFRRPDFPFYFVQIAPFRYGDSIGAAAEMRDVQRRCLATPNTGMAVTLDIGDLADIHPKNKEDVGKRLARWALAKTYGKSDVVPSGPLPRVARRDRTYMVVEFDYAEGLRATTPVLGGFELAGADRNFLPAEAAIVGTTVQLRSSAVPDPIFVRYLWSDTAEATLFNAAGLPATSFELP